MRAQKMIALCRDAGATIAPEVLDTGHAGVSNVWIADIHVSLCQEKTELS